MYNHGKNKMSSFSKVITTILTHNYDMFSVQLIEVKIKMSFRETIMLIYSRAYLVYFY